MGVLEGGNTGRKSRGTVSDGGAGVRIRTRIRIILF